MNILSGQIKNEGIWVEERKGFGQKKRKQFLLDLKGGRRGGDLRGLKEEKDTMTNWIKGKIGLIK